MDSAFDSGDATPPEADFSQFVSASSDWFWMTGPDLRLTFVSKRFFEQTGLPTERLIGRHVADFARASANGPDVERLLIEIRDYRPFKNILYPLRGGQGTTHYMRINGIPAFTTDNTFLGYRGTGCDATAEIWALEGAKRLQADLAKSEQRLRGILDHIADGIVTIDGQGIIESCNPATLQMFGYSEAELVGQNVSILIPGAEHTRHDGYIRHYITTGKGRIINVGPREVLARRKDGSVFPMDLTVGEMCLDGHRHFVGAMRDITARKHAADELERSRQSLADAQRIARIGNWSIDLATEEVHWSDELYRQLGLDPMNFKPTAEASLAYLHPDDAALIHRLIGEVVRGPDRRASCDYRALSRDGVVRIIHAEFRAILDRDGTPARVVGTAQDVTDLRRAREDLERSERMLMDAQRVAKLGSWHTDLKTGVVHWSEGLYKIGGLDPARHRPSDGVFLSLVHPGDLDKVPWVTERDFGGLGDQVAGDYRILLPDGQERILHSEVELVRDETGCPVEAIGIAQDVTEQRAAEKELLRALDIAEAADRSKSEFLANMSHELRTPLNAIIGFSEMIRDAVIGPVDVRYSEYAGDVNNAGRHLQNIINDILDISKIESHRMELRDDVVSVVEITEACARMVASMAELSEVSLILDVPEALPLLRADHVRFKQILLNLMSNAVKFTPTGGHVRMSAAIERDGAVIAVEDTGLGMKAEEIEIALQPFRQIDGTLTRRFEGTGLGLPLAKALTELHGGRLQIESTPGIGTRVSIHLPGDRVLKPDAVLQGVTA